MEYKLKTTKEDLIKKGFHYNKSMSDDMEVYSLRFPVHKYKKHITLEAELAIVLQTGEVIINVFNYGTNERYFHYYNQEYGKCELLDSINKEISNKLNKIGAKEVKKK